jgi:hypothetical protein
MIHPRIRRLFKLSLLVATLGLPGTYGLVCINSSSAATSGRPTSLRPATVEPISAGASKPGAKSFSSRAPREPGQGAQPSTVRMESAAPRLLARKQPLKSLLPVPTPAPAPTSGSSLPNPPTPNSPADGSTGVSSSPTLNTTVSDPNSGSVTVNFYGKVVPSVTSPAPNFSIIELPDTQYYSSNLAGGALGMFQAQTQWIINTRIANNIAFVIGLGDIVQDGNNGGNYSQWVNANSAVSLLDNPSTTGLPQGIPYSFGVGNHDEGPAGNGSPNDTGGYNQYFGISRYSGKSYYGGHYGTQNDNHYELFSASGMDFIVINLAYDESADPNVLAWANSLLQTYSSRRGIVMSHYLINDGFNASWSSQGQATYNALRGNPNLFLMLCGHWTPPEGQRADVWNGNRVYTLMSDYQETGGGGDGWLRMLTFSPASNQVHVQTYSPFLNQSQTSSSSDFTVSYDMQGSGNGFTLIGSKPGVPSGSQSTVNWPNLAAGTQYEWYVTVSNSTGTTIGPLWSFTTAGSSPVTLSPSSLNFSSQAVGTSSTAQTVTLSNAGSTPLTVSSIVASAQYAQTNNCPSSPSAVAAGGSCTINITFSPAAAGTITGAVTISDSAIGSPQQIGLTGTGWAAAPAVSLSSASLAFAGQALNTTSPPQTVTLTNTGTGPLTVTTIAAGVPYGQNNNCTISSIPVSGSCTINVTFSPTATGTQTGTVTIMDNAAGSPHTISLFGTGVAATFAISGVISPATSGNGATVTLGGAVPVLVRSAPGASSGGNSSATAVFSAPSAPGNTMVVFLRFGGTTITSVTDNQPGGSNTYNSVLGPSLWGTAAQGTVDRYAQVFVAKNIIGGSKLTITVRLAGNSTRAIYMTALEYSGVDPVNPVNATAFRTGTTATNGAPATANLTTTVSNAKLVATSWDSNESYIASGNGSGYTTESSAEIVSISGGSGWPNLTEDRTAAAAGTWNATASSLPAVRDWAIQLVALAPAGSQAVTADAGGNYTFSGLANGSYTVTPGKTGFTFSPTSQAATLNGANVTGLNFTAP